MKHITKPAAILLIVAIVTTALLSLVYAMTLEPIEENRQKVRIAAMQTVLPNASEFVELDVEAPGSIVAVYEALGNGQSIGYIVELSTPGYSGDIDIVVGISSIDDAISGMRVLRHTETPGLGANATNESFYSQYSGRPLNPLRVVKSSPGPDDIHAITSATITTDAITDAVNEAIQWYNGGGME